MVRLRFVLALALTLTVLVTVGCGGKKKKCPFAPEICDAMQWGDADTDCPVGEDDGDVSDSQDSADATDTADSSDSSDGSDAADGSDATDGSEDDDDNAGCYEVCHFPRGNRSNFKTICVGSEDAFEAHMAHGDLEGACEDF